MATVRVCVCSGPAPHCACLRHRCTSTATPDLHPPRRHIIAGGNLGRRHSEAINAVRGRQGYVTAVTAHPHSDRAARGKQTRASGARRGAASGAFRPAQPRVMTLLVALIGWRRASRPCAALRSPHRGSRGAGPRRARATNPRHATRRRRPPAQAKHRRSG